MLLNYVPRASGSMKIGRGILASRLGASNGIRAAAGRRPTSPCAALQSLGVGSKPCFSTRVAVASIENGIA